MGRVIVELEDGASGLSVETSVESIIERVGNFERAGREEWMM